MFAIRLLKATPKEFQSIKTVPLTQEELNRTEEIMTFIKELVAIRKAKVNIETKHGFSAYAWAKNKMHSDLMIYLKIMQAQQEIEHHVMEELQRAKQFYIATGLKQTELHSTLDKPK